MLGTMSALGAFSADMYLPNLPNVAHDLGTTASMAQLTMTFMLAGAAIGQLVVGPLSDHFGRRRPALIGTGLHIVTCIFCATAPAVFPMIGYRLAMGFFNACSMVVATAVVRDRFVGRDAARLISRLQLIIGVSPLLAPTVGSFIGQYVGWRGVFGALGLYGVGLFLAILLKLPETLPVARRSPAVRDSYRGFVYLLRDRNFIALAVIPGLLMGVLMSYIVSSPFVLQGEFGLGKFQFALIFACNGIAQIGGAQANAALVKHFTSSQVLRVALPGSFLACLSLFVIGLTGWGKLAGFLVALFCVQLLQNLSPSNASALALTRHGERAGTAAACIGFLQSAVPATVAPAVGLLGNQSWSMGLMMAVCSGVALVVLALGTPIYRPGGTAELDRIPKAVGLARQP